MLLRAVVFDLMDTDDLAVLRDLHPGCPLGSEQSPQLQRERGNCRWDQWNTDGLATTKTCRAGAPKEGTESSMTGLAPFGGWVR